IRRASEKLVNAAGNFYVNDKPTGAVVGLQPFGGARASGTNDKAGSFLNLIRWVSPRVIKETYAPPTEHRYPSMEDDHERGALQDPGSAGHVERICAGPSSAEGAARTGPARTRPARE